MFVAYLYLNGTGQVGIIKLYVNKRVWHLLGIGLVWRG